MNTPIRVLLLEDDPADARLVEVMLRRLPRSPFEVTSVGRLGEALLMLRGGGIDIILADLAVPDSNGIGTMLALSEAAPDLPVVVLTGNDDDRLALDALKRGAQDYLVKGKSDASVLSRVIRYAIERKASERALKDALERAEGAARAKSLFLAMVGHEIRTPLNGILGMARLLLDTGLDHRQRTFAETVVSSGELLLGLVNDILDFSRLEAEGLTLEVIGFDIVDTVEELRLLLAPRAAEKALALNCRFDPAVRSAVRGDALRVRQVLLNLIGNAIKFTDKGGVTIAVAPVGETRRGQPQILRFEVADTGIGIPEEARADLFTEFSQADSSIARRYGGAGLGLAICKRLVTLMGGSIGFASQPGQGSTFWFEIPLLEGDAQGRSRRPVAAPSQPRTVLLVDDNAVNREVAAGLLERQGHHVQSAEDGPAAIAAARQGGFDLILLDMRMPGMDGLETAQAIRVLPPPAGRVPIYLLTANPRDEDERRWREIGVDGCLAKPFRVEELERLLSEAGGGAASGGEATLVGLPDLLADLKDLGAERMLSLFELFRRTAAADMDAARQAFAAGGIEQTGQLVHRMASAASSMHLVALTASCRAMENAARAKDHAALAAQIEALPDLWDRSLQALSNVLGAD